MDRAFRLRWTVVAGLSLLGVAALTLVPAPGSAEAIRATPWWCVRCGAAGSADLFQNLLLFLPLGFALGRLRWGRLPAAVLLLVLPLLIELSQYTWIVGRDATLGDVLANAGGGMIGWWWGSGARMPISGTRHGWRTAALLLGLFSAQLLATTSLVRPALRGPTPWQLRAAPHVVGKPIYRGDIMMLGRNGRAILNASDARSQDEGSTDLAWLAQFTGQSIRSGETLPVLRLDDARGWPLFALDLRRSAAGVEVRSLGGALRFRSPTWLAPLPPNLTDRDTIVVSYTASHGHVELRTRAHATTLVSRFAVGAQHGWSLINPFTPTHRDPTTWQRWTLAWLLGWGIVLGLSTASVRAPVAWGVAALLTLGGGSWWSGTLIGWEEGAALCVGWMLGWGISSRRRAHPTPVAVGDTTSHPLRAPGHQ